MTELRECHEPASPGLHRNESRCPVNVIFHKGYRDSGDSLHLTSLAGSRLASDRIGAMSRDLSGSAPSGVYTGFGSIVSYLNQYFSGSDTHQGTTELSEWPLSVS